MIKAIILLIVFLVGNWILDVGHVAYFIFGSKGTLTNGLWTVSALTAYHLGWYISIAAFFIVIILYIKEKEKNNRLKMEVSGMHECADCHKLISRGKYCLYHLVDSKGRERK